MYHLCETKVKFKTLYEYVPIVITPHCYRVNVLTYTIILHYLEMSVDTSQCSVTDLDLSNTKKSPFFFSNLTTAMSISQIPANQMIY